MVNFSADFSGIRDLRLVDNGIKTTGYDVIGGNQSKTVIIALASATGEKTPLSPLPGPNIAPLARAKEGPKAPTQAR